MHALLDTRALMREVAMDTPSNKPNRPELVVMSTRLLATHVATPVFCRAEPRAKEAAIMMRMRGWVDTSASSTVMVRSSSREATPRHAVVSRSIQPIESHRMTIVSTMPLHHWRTLRTGKGTPRDTAGGGGHTAATGVAVSTAHP